MRKKKMEWDNEKEEGRGAKKEERDRDIERNREKGEMIDTRRLDCSLVCPIHPLQGTYLPLRFRFE